MKYLKAILGAISLIFIISALSDISQAVIKATIRCINIIIPSLFVMMAASRYIISRDLLRPLEILFRPLAVIMGMNERLVSVFLVSSVGGYPIGASIISQMRQNGQLSEKDASVIASYCFCSGPAFVVGAVGLCVYGGRNIGYMMFASCVAANLIACIVYNRMFRINKLIVNDDNSTVRPYSLTDAISDSGKALFSMCGVIIAFSLVSVVLEKVSRISGTDLTLISPLFEITNVTSIDPMRKKLLPLVTAFVSFGGICVWLQNSALVGKSFSISKALLLRIPISALSGVIFKALYSWIFDQYLSSNADFNGFVVNIDNFLPSICLIIMIFLLIEQKRLAFLKKV